jgi:metal-responsive CopG/Arc/MetJ family transcriptional regulator
MKTAVSVPDQVFHEAEQVAKRLNVSRSELYTRALSEYLVRHTSEEVTARWNEVIRELGQPSDEFTRRAANRILKLSEW